MGLTDCDGPGPGERLFSSKSLHFSHLPVPMTQSTSTGNVHFVEWHGAAEGTPIADKFLWVGWRFPTASPGFDAARFGTVCVRAGR